MQPETPRTVRQISNPDIKVLDRLRVTAHLWTRHSVRSGKYVTSPAKAAISKLPGDFREIGLTCDQRHHTQNRIRRVSFFRLLKLLRVFYSFLCLCFRHVFQVLLESRVLLKPPRRRILRHIHSVIFRGFPTPTQK